MRESLLATELLRLKQDSESVREFLKELSSPSEKALGSFLQSYTTEEGSFIDKDYYLGPVTLIPAYELGVPLVTVLFRRIHDRFSASLHSASITQLLSGTFNLKERNLGKFETTSRYKVKDGSEDTVRFERGSFLHQADPYLRLWITYADYNIQNWHVAHRSQIVDADVPLLVA